MPTTLTPPRAADRQRGGSPNGEIQLQAPPVLAKGSGAGLNQLMFMLPMMLGMGAMSFYSMGSKGGAMTYVFGALYGSTMIGMILMSLTRGSAQKKAQINDERRDYHRYLAALRGQVRDVAAAQRATLTITRPEPDDLWLRVAQGRAWERRRTDDDFGHARGRPRPAAPGHPAARPADRAAGGPGPGVLGLAAAVHPHLHDRPGPAGGAVAEGVRLGLGQRRARADPAVWSGP